MRQKDGPEIAKTLFVVFNNCQLHVNSAKHMPNKPLYIIMWSDRAFGNSGNGRLKRKTEMVKMKIVYFQIHTSLKRPPVKQDH